MEADLVNEAVRVHECKDVPDGFVYKQYVYHTKGMGWTFDVKGLDI